MPILSIENSGKQAPEWFRRFKKIWVNTENAAVVLLLAKNPVKYAPLSAGIKVGSSWLLENIETLLAPKGSVEDTAVAEIPSAGPIQSTQTA